MTPASPRLPPILSTYCRPRLGASPFALANHDRFPRGFAWLRLVPPLGGRSLVTPISPGPGTQAPPSGLQSASSYSLMAWSDRPMLAAEN
jgi:hypothetical protein